MKKTISILVSLVMISFVLSLASCAESMKRNEDMMNDPANIIENSKDETIKIDDIDALTWDTYEKSTAYRRNVFGDEHYKTDVEYGVTDPKACVDEYLSENAWTEIQPILEKTDRVDMLPIVGYFFQTTDLAVVVFYDDNVKIGAVIVQLDESLSKINNRFNYNSTEMNNAFLGFKDTFSPDGCLEHINDTESYFEGFTVTALMFNVSESLGNGSLMCVGKYDNDESLYVHHYAGIIDIPYIGKVTSIKEAREKYAEFKVFEKEQYQSLKLFEWWDGLSGYMSMVSGSAHRDDYPSFLKTGEYEWYLEVGLINGDYKSDEYVWGLVYDGSKLIAEVIVHKNKETSEREVIVMTDAKKNENGEYVAQSSELIDLFNRVKSTNENIDIVGIQYDGSDVSILYRQDDTVLKYK